MFQRVWATKWRYANTMLYWSGAAWAFEKVTHPTGAVILMYHSVADEEVAKFIDPPNHFRSAEFERQMAFLSGNRKVVSLTELLAQLDAGKVPSAGTVCITFDDGYLDNLTVAAPILEKYKLPATLYLPTAYIDRGETHWADIVHQLFRFRTRDQLTMPLLGISANLADKMQRMSAYKLLHGPLLTSLYSDRQALLAEVREQLQPSQEGPRLTMNWDEIRELGQRFPLFSIGGHSQCHVDLSAYGGQYAHDEIEGCKRSIQQKLGIDPQHFSFPYSRWSTETKSLVEQCGWKSAVGDGHGVLVGLESDRFVLPRLSTPVSMTDLRFKTCGSFPGVYALLGR
jgi:peptidoglycan/xylan/chitin deacetylase (PgdA/CDA1 family)